MTPLLLVAANVCRGVLARRGLYVWAAALLLMLLRSGPLIFRTYDDPHVGAVLRAEAISQAVDTWALLALAGAIFLGASTVAGEKTNKTISTLLARPIHRWQLMAGHLLGVTIYSLTSVGIGLAFAAGLSTWMGISINWEQMALAVGATTAGIVLFAATGVALGSNVAVAIAASATVLLAFVPPVAETLRKDAKPLQHYSGIVVDYLTPPGYRGYYMGVAWAEIPAVAGNRPRSALFRPPVNYADARERMLANAGYGLVYFLLGTAVFMKRDVKLG
jgi:hypothetical protein